MTASTADNIHNDAACVKLFTDTMARLNEINERQMTAVLKMAIAGAEAARSIDPSNTDAEALVEKVTGLIDELKANADDTDATEHREHSSTKGDTFCEMVENNLNLAMENSLSAQQELFQIGMSVLAEAARLVLDSAGSSQAE